MYKLTFSIFLFLFNLSLSHCGCVNRLFFLLCEMCLFAVNLCASLFIRLTPLQSLSAKHLNIILKLIECEKRAQLQCTFTYIHTYTRIQIHRSMYGYGGYCIASYQPWQRLWAPCTADDDDVDECGLWKLLKFNEEKITFVFLLFWRTHTRTPFMQRSTQYAPQHRCIRNTTK